MKVKFIIKYLGQIGTYLDMNVIIENGSINLNEKHFEYAILKRFIRHNSKQWDPLKE